MRWVISADREQMHGRWSHCPAEKLSNIMWYVTHCPGTCTEGALALLVTSQGLYILDVDTDE